MTSYRPLLLVALTALSLPLAAQVVINEFTASNRGIIADNNGDFRDWVELYNASPDPVDLTGWYLSDSQNNNTKWQFPAGSNIAGNGFLLVWCSGENVSVGNLHHTNFRFNQTQQERAVLSTPDGTIVSNFQMQLRTKTDHSWGRVTDGDAQWSLFTTPTPGGPNVNPDPYYAARPEFSQQGGFYNGAVNLSMSSPDADVQIRYTLNGSTPNAASTLYTAPISINATTVVRAACFPNDPTIPFSFEEFFTYFINEDHTLPVFSLGGDNDLDDLFGGDIQLRPIGTAEYYGENGDFRDKTMGESNKHGNDSWAYQQRGIDYISRDQYGYNDGFHWPIFRTKTRDQYQRVMFKAAANDNYPFQNGGAHVRDAFVMAHSQVWDLDVDERSHEPCILYVNGQYWGVYDVREKVDDPDFTEYYYGQKRTDIYFLKTWGGTWEEYGQGFALNEWNQLRNYIETNDMGDPGNFAYVDGLFNWQSLVDYVVINSYIVSADWLNWNTGWWRGTDPLGQAQRWRYILWDMDAAFDHYINYTGVPDVTAAADPCNAENLPNPGGQGHTVILNKLMEENEMVRNYYVNRYIDLGNTAYHCDNWLPFLDSLIALIEPEMPRQIQRWGGTMAGWQANVADLRAFIEERCEAIQEGLVDCYDLEGPYDMVFNVNPPGSGTIRINSITPDEYPFHGVYYGNIPAELAAIPEEEWVFSHWEIFGPTTIDPDLNDSLVTAMFYGADSIVAHFIPPITHEVMLDVVPPGGGALYFNGVLYEEFPVYVEVPEGFSVNAMVIPAEYYEFLYWSLENHDMVPPDSTEMQIAITFLTTDTLIAHLKPDEHGYYLPNAFTPNGDGINDIFQPLGSAVDRDAYELVIYDRWGNMLFNSVDPGVGWDGTSGGRQMPTGVYVFTAQVRDAISGEKHEFTGHVTLVR